MVTKLNDEDLLDYLMTSDYTEDYSPSDYRYLLNKFKYFFRLNSGKSDRITNEYEGKMKKLELRITDLENTLSRSILENREKDDLIFSMKNRKLTLKERLTGKLNK